jgi:hypothetical protein
MTMMACGAVAGLMCEDGCYDLTCDGETVGRLIWVEERSERWCAGWWLTAPGVSDELIYRVPPDLLGDLPEARRESVSMSLGLAEQLLGSRIEGPPRLTQRRAPR